MAAEFTIYSVGDARFLGEILNAVAMISGTGDVEALARIGLMFGVFLIAFQAVSNNTGIQFHKLLVCVILYLAMFGATATAIVEDKYTGAVEVVDGVPLGPVAVGSFLSGIGITLSELFEQGFSTPAMTQYGFADPLDTLMKFRRVTQDMTAIPAFNQTGGAGDLYTSWMNYVRECTMVNIERDPSAFNKIKNEGSPMQALRFDSAVYGTLIYAPGGEELLNCSDAHTRLVELTTSQLPSLMDSTKSAFPKLNDGFEVEGKVTDSLNSLGIAASDAREFALASALLPVFQDGPASKAMADMQDAAAIMMSQAVMQQNTQWAAEGNMFVRNVRPFLTFFEGFIYAISPLMAFILVLGTQGISMLGKYLLMAAWMMLWTPIMAIVNLFIISGAKYQIQSLMLNQLQTSQITFESVMQVERILGTWVGVGGYMASSVPVLCGFLVWGGSVAGMSIANRMNGRDTIDEKIASPDVVSPGAGMAMSALAQNDPTMGSRISNSEMNRPNLNANSALTSSVQSAQQTAEGAQTSLNQAFSRGVQNSYQNASSSTDLAQLGQTVGGAYGVSGSSTYKDFASQARSEGISEKSVNAYMGAIGASGSAGLEALGTGAKLSGQVGKNLTESDNKDLSRLAQIGEETGFNKALTGSINNGVNAQQAHSLSNAETSTFSSSDSEQISKQSQQTLSAQKSYQEMSGLQNMFGSSSSIKLDAVAQDVLKSDGAAERLQQAVYGAGLQEKAASFASTYGSTMADPKAAQVAGMVQALATSGDWETVASVMPGTTGFSVSNDAHNSNIMMNGPSVDAAGLSNRFDQMGVNDVSGAAGASARESLFQSGKTQAENLGNSGINDARSDHRERADQLEVPKVGQFGAGERLTHEVVSESAGVMGAALEGAAELGIIHPNAAGAYGPGQLRPDSPVPTSLDNPPPAPAHTGGHDVDDVPHLPADTRPSAMSPDFSPKQPKAQYSGGHDVLDVPQLPLESGTTDKPPYMPGQ
ncbi:conjugal transfer protein TraG N-terminal domain-containing protein [Pseudomonas rhodesiae]|uniref:conjugal transfer protein TraG N-terminal domain-containing protein n=1 Tax=Pseudomonas rhodesiae TaxID=76760 RepID=UPI00209E20F0|nr:conjugal transfer protein TraG N-terminal domain-containing protein [Pseudomonas rhodesiae]MCP1515617.1 conjugal transfer mating pair stabilization protein TraG [Pseudomonas rhodesiae]MDF9773021.1 conjugal transfer mating pair stabilization protein TraG [Pseudomonas rhodesiae]